MFWASPIQHKFMTVLMVHIITFLYAWFLSKLFSAMVLMQMGPGVPVSIQSLSKAADNYKKVHLVWVMDEGQLWAFNMNLSFDSTCWRSSFVVYYHWFYEVSCVMYVAISNWNGDIFVRSGWIFGSPSGVSCSLSQSCKNMAYEILSFKVILS